MSRENLESLRDRVGKEVQAQQASVDSVDEAAARCLGVNRTDLRCLEFLLQHGAATPGQIATELGLTTGSVTAMLDRLVKLGHLTRSPDPADRRKVVVEITPAAAAKAWEIYGPIAQDGAALVATYSAEELAIIIDFLQRSRELQQTHRSRIAALPKTTRT